jgi:hypothetical protein
VIAPGLICPAGGILVGGLPLCNGAGGIVPYANGANPVVLSTLVGLAHIGAAVGFGSSSSRVALTGPIVANTTVGNFAFTAPRNLTLNSLYFDYTNSLALTLVGATNLVVRVEVYEAVLPSATFTPLSPPFFATGTITGPVITAGQSTSGHAFSSVKIIQVPATAAHCVGRSLLRLRRAGPMCTPVAHFLVLIRVHDCCLSLRSRLQVARASRPPPAFSRLGWATPSHCVGWSLLRLRRAGHCVGQSRSGAMSFSRFLSHASYDFSQITLKNVH